MKNLLDDWNENDEHWAFTSHSDPNGIQIQATNCAKCGDYIMFNSDIHCYNNNNNRRNTTPFSDKIFCNCKRNCNEPEDDYEYDSDYYREYAIERDYQYENKKNTDYDYDYELELEYDCDYETDCELESYE